MIAPFGGRCRADPRPLLAPDPEPEASGSTVSDAQRADTAPGTRPEPRRGRMKRAKEPASGAPIEQFPSAWPNAPENAQGIARTLSRGLS
jgi:hypothetical protein